MNNVLVKSGVRTRGIMPTMLLGCKKECWRVVLSLITPVLMLGACTRAPAPIYPTATPLGFITPYQSPTLTETMSSPMGIESTPIPHPVPTQTPYLYKVVKGDTMLGIALRFGLSLEELQAANPDVDPRFLSIGVNLVIPLNQGTPESASTPAPVPLWAAEPVCYSTAEGGLWCYYLVRNSTDEDLDNLSAQIILASDEPGITLEGTAFPPLNLLPSGKAMPLSIFFSPPTPMNYSVRATLVSALPVASSDRYLPAKIQVDRVEIDQTGAMATATGEVSLPKKSIAAHVLWISGVAYSADGAVVGVRKLDYGEVPSTDPSQIQGTSPADQTASPTTTSETPELETQQPGPPLLNSGESLPFELTIYSLGPKIDHVEILVEARP